MYQIFRPSPKHIPYTSYSKITKPNTVHQCDLIKIPYDEDVNTNLLDDGPIYYYVLLVIDCATRYKDFVFLTSKSSEEVAEAFKSIYDLINLLTGLENCNVIRALSLWDT